MSTVHVVGLDLSLASTGVCLAAPGHMRTLRIESAHHGDEYPVRAARLRLVVTRCWRYLHGADLVVIEGPSLGSSPGTSGFDRHGLWWLTVARITGHDIPLAVVSPSTLKVYATGKGRWPGENTKDRVLASVVRNYPHVNVNNNNEADALVLAAMGLRHLGQPYDRLTESHTRAMAAVAWPPLVKGATSP